jgi:hypothetical protein
MTFTGRIQNGVVILDGAPKLPEGMPVRVQTVRTTTRKTKSANGSSQKKKTLGQRLMKFAGTAKGLPRDMARNHDHYIHGTRRK